MGDLLWSIPRHFSACFPGVEIQIHEQLCCLFGCSEQNYDAEIKLLMTNGLSHCYQILDTSTFMFWGIRTDFHFFFFFHFF